jgi:nucleoside-diphosphate-sugar epimerase
MNILVTGGAGVMGSRLVRGLAAAGHRLRVLTLPGDPNAAKLADIDCEVIYGDIADAASLRGICNGVDTVYHLAAVIIAYDRSAFRRINVGGTRNLLEAAVASGVQHFIHVSSHAVTCPGSSDYARSKLDAEQLVRSQTRLAWTVVRPTLAYGRDEGQEFMMFVESLKKYPVVPFVGRGDALKTPVLADDIMKGLLKIAGNEQTYGKTYNFTGGEEISIRDLTRLIMKHKGISKPVLHIPEPVCRLMAFIMERTMARPPLTRYAISRIVLDANPSNLTAREDLGYNPTGVTEGLKRCYPLDGAGRGAR